MKIKDLEIGTQLKLGFGFIILLIFILSIISWTQTDKIATQVTDMYNHPLKVRRALGELKSDILYIRLGMKDLSLTENIEEIEGILQSIEILEVHAFEQFEVMSTLYLGPAEDIKIAYRDFLKWNTIRDVTIRLKQEGETEESAARSRTGGVGVNQAETLLTHFQKIDTFALSKADQLYLNSVVLNETLNYQLGFLIFGIITLMFLIVYLLIKSIRKPLSELISVSQSFKEGHFNVRSQYISSNEFGQLSSSFNNLADTIETELALNSQSSILSKVMLSEDDAHRFCHALLNSILEQTGSQMSAIYLLNKEKTNFEHFECLGMNSEGCKPFSAVHFDGEFGPALASQKIQHIKDIPEDSRFEFSTVSGSFTPREIITIPIVSGEETKAVISLVTIKSFSLNTLRLLNTILDTLSARLDGILAFREVIDFSQQLEQQNSELESQKKELSRQTSELTEQNIELEMQKKQLDEANQMKTSFLSNMSHELRTPLNSVIALSGVLNRRLVGKVADEEYSYIDVIERNGKQLLALINNILDLSRIEAGHEDLEIKNFKVKDLINNVVEMIEPQALLKNIRLHYLREDDQAEITSDYEKCHHILQNLVANAVKFTDEGGVEITVEVKAETIDIAVTDTGIGISNENLSLIFDEFRQADGSNSRKYGGTGLGLAIAQKYAQFLGGKIKVESSYGNGSRFIINLPLQIANKQAIVETARISRQVPIIKASQHVEHLITSDKTILLVEDNEAVIIQMKDMLTQEGYNIVVAHNGSEALEKIALKIPDAMILDLMMPEIDGFEVLRCVREKERTNRLPVIILTAKFISKKELSFLKHNGIHQLIQKGDINKDQLLNEIAQMMFPEPKEQNNPEKRLIRKPISGLPVVLVVEDNPDNMLSIKALLDGMCTIIEAEDGHIGIEMAQIHQPHLILMDIALPGMNGIEALNQLRKEHSTQDIPIIAVSASAMKGDKEDFISLGFDGYIPKPIDHKKLKKVIKEWIGSFDN